jgi:branched-chain amino acid aminotransferase
VHTPTPDCFLDGITRRAVMAMARQRQMKVVERAIMPEDLGKAQEVFLTGTAAEITPVGQIDDYRFTPATITHTLMGDFEKATRG